nr:putative capsid [Marmot picobirnavirus]
MKGDTFMSNVNKEIIKDDSNSFSEGKSKGSKTQNRRSSKNNRSRSRNNNHNRNEGGQKSKVEFNTNDVAWYTLNPQLLRDTASIPFSWASGVPVNFDFRGGITDRASFPGIMNFWTVPSFGWSANSSSALNNAATKVYSFVRHENSGHSNYDAPDLMIYLCAMTQVYSAINWLQRLYSQACVYSPVNRYIPRAIIEEQHVSYDDIIANLANFRYGINSLIAKAASLAVPSTLPVFRRMAFLYQNVYCESESLKDQLYMYTPASFMYFTLNEDTKAGQLVTFTDIRDKSYTGQLLTVANLIEIVNRMLAPIIGSEDMNIMSGDILKAYGKGNILTLSPIDTYLSITPIYDPEVLEQMKNAEVIHPKLFDYDAIKLQQDPNIQVGQSNLQFKPQLIPAAYFNASVEQVTSIYKNLVRNHVITSSLNDVTPERVMTDTRLTIAYELNEAENRLNMHTGSEIVVQCNYGYFTEEDNGTLTYHQGAICALNPMICSSYSSIAGNIGSITRTRCFKYKPFSLCCLFSSQSATTPSSITIDFDVDNWGLVNDETLRNIHDVAWLGLFNVKPAAQL